MPSLLERVEPLAHDLIIRLLDGSFQGAIVVALVWIVCAGVKAIPASVRAWLWWLALLKLVMALLMFPAIPVPVLPSTPQGAARHAGHRVVDTAALAVPVETMKRLPRAILPAAASDAAQSNGWRSSIAALAMGIITIWWMVLLGMQCIALAATRRRLSALMARSRPVDDHDLQEAQRLARVLRLRCTPDIRASDEITSPQVVGGLRPCVLLPAAMTAFSEEERRMMLCHELMHVRRRDLVLGWIPALAERSFFFNPLARLAAREYVLAREAACDAAVLRILDVEPQQYARLLMRLGIVSTPPEFSAAASSPTASLLRRRLELLYVDAVASRGRGRLWLAGVAVALAFVPIQLTARSVSPSPAERMVVAPSRAGALAGTRDTRLPVAFQEQHVTASPADAIGEVHFGAAPRSRDVGRRSARRQEHDAASPDSQVERQLQLLRLSLQLLSRQQGAARSGSGNQSKREGEALLREFEGRIAFARNRLEEAGRTLEEGSRDPRQPAAVGSGPVDHLRRELEKMNEYLGGIARDDAGREMQRHTEDVSRALEDVTLQQEAAGREAAETQRALAGAQQNLARQRVLFEDARRRLADAEELLRRAQRALGPDTSPAK